jgi:hypothetical protein
MLRFCNRPADKKAACEAPQAQSDIGTGQNPRASTIFTDFGPELVSNRSTIPLMRN